MKIGYKSILLGQALGLSDSDIQQIQNVHSHTATQSLMICFKWMLQSGDKATFKNLEMAFKRANIDTDILESVNKAVDIVSCLPPDVLDMQPDDKHMNQISSRIETEHVHLGVELKVPWSRIERILIENPVDVHRQCFEIMKEWRQGKFRRATFRNLEKAFIWVGINPDILNQSLK
ncbi:hypothetical protein ACJMK2_009562 [Sinanodonta woodiana]|uniref:Death domain-containing protein n=1 Tax=Sinanodonta woodiana TaxID=1069815 RepID=A0ABD3VCN7_SINWO